MIKTAFLTATLLATNFVLAQDSDTKYTIDVELDQCIKKDDSTDGIIKCANIALVKWDEKLNFYYNNLKEIISNEQIERLKTAQKAWLDFRDKEIEFFNQYHVDEGGAEWAPAGIALHKVMQTKERALEIRNYIPTEWTSIDGLEVETEDTTTELTDNETDSITTNNDTDNTITSNNYKSDNPAETIAELAYQLMALNSTEKELKQLDSMLKMGIGMSARDRMEVCANEYISEYSYDEQMGLAHFVELILTKGTEKLNDKDEVWLKANFDKYNLVGNLVITALNTKCFEFE